MHLSYPCVFKANHHDLHRTWTWRSAKETAVTMVTARISHAVPATVPAELVIPYLELKALVNDQDLCTSKLSDDFLLKCLRSRTDVEEAFLVAKRFVEFRLKSGWPLELSARRLGPLDTDAHWLLPGRDMKGRAVVVVNARHMDMKRATMEEYQKVGQFLLEVATRDVATQKEGVALVVNVAEAGLGLMASVSVQDMARTCRMWQDAFPAKLKAIYVVGGSRLLCGLVKAGTSFLNKKLRERVIALERSTDLQRYIDYEQLPTELGGGLDVRWREWVAAVREQDGVQLTEIPEN